MSAAAGERPWLTLRGLRKRGRVQAACVVLNGARAADLRRASELTAMLAERCMLVAVDGGIKTCRRIKRRPDLFVGDGDSAGRVPEDLEAVVFPEDKSFSDLAGALDELARRKVQVVGVAGLLGGRLDHEWANLFEIGGLARRFAGIVASTERGTVLFTAHGCTAITVPGHTFSLFPLNSRTTVTLQGAEWGLERGRLRTGSHGLSNVTGTGLDLTVHSGATALVFPVVRRRGG